MKRPLIVELFNRFFVEPVLHRGDVAAFKRAFSRSDALESEAAAPSPVKWPLDMSRIAGGLSDEEGEEEGEEEGAEEGAGGTNQCSHTKVCMHA